MPKYTAKLTVPTANNKLDPIEHELKISQGRIAQVTVTWSPGSQWVNCLVIKYEGGQIIPSEGGGEIRGDGFPDTWPEHIVIDKPHPVLNIEAWNEDNAYEQEVLVSVVVLPFEPEPLKPVKELAAAFKRLVGL